VTQLVVGEVPGDPEQPGAESAIRIEAADLPDHVDPGLLEGVLGRLAIAQDRLQIPHQVFSVAIDDLRQRFAAAVPEAPQEGPLVRIPLHPGAALRSCAHRHLIPLTPAIG
jgi:hypothetical protein